MSLIWLIERPRSVVPSVLSTVIGEYPIKAIASFQSMMNLCRLETTRQQNPDLVLVNLPDKEVDIRWADSVFVGLMPRVKRVFILDRPPASAAGDLVCLPRSCDEHELRKVVRTILCKDKVANTGFIHFKDVTLDPGRFCISIAPDESLDSLPMKEGLILKLLLGKPGHCFSRDDIRNAVWQGGAVSSRTIDSHISRLRKRLNHSSVSLENVYGGGYLAR